MQRRMQRAPDAAGPLWVLGPEAIWVTPDLIVFLRNRYQELGGRAIPPPRGEWPEPVRIFVRIP